MPDKSGIPLGELPEFEQPMAKTLQVVRGYEPDAIAHTENGGNKVFVDDPQRMTRPILAHEVMHKIQQKAGLFQPTDDSSYDYGGIQGLQKLRAAGKTISSLNPEQQANIPQDYMTQMSAWGKQPITKGILGQADQMNKTFEPFLRQEEAMAQPGINVTPPAPGPPPASITGMIKPLSMMGGPSMNIPKMGR